jgi:hypothetical protein
MKLDGRIHDLWKTDIAVHHLKTILSAQEQ